MKIQTHRTTRRITRDGRKRGRARISQRRDWRMPDWAIDQLMDGFIKGQMAAVPMVDAGNGWWNAPKPTAPITYGNVGYRLGWENILLRNRCVIGHHSQVIAQVVERLSREELDVMTGGHADRFGRIPDDRPPYMSTRATIIPPRKLKQREPTEAEIAMSKQLAALEW